MGGCCRQPKQRSSRMRVIQFVCVGLLSVMCIPAFAACSDYDFDFYAQPSFIPSSQIQVRAHHARTITIEYGGRVEKTSLSESAVEQFCTRMQQVISMEQASDDRIGLDGISARGQLKVNGAPAYQFKFLSPDKENQPRDFAIAEAVFTLLETTVPSCELNIYLELLAAYFDFGLPARVIRGRPLTVRLHGGLSINHADDLAVLFASLPADIPLDVDMTNVRSMGTALFPQFQILLTRKQPVKWLANPATAFYLHQLGVKGDQIEITGSVYCVPPHTQFSRR
jgi:hypothetical protein